MEEPKRANSEDENPQLSQLVDMFIYAPIGMLYEYPDVLPQLIKKGKSQVQIAKVMGEFALRKGQADPTAFATEGFASAGGAIAKLITELSDMFIGAAASEPQGSQRPQNKPAEVESAPSAAPAQHLPIANYDSLTAREIVGLLGDITPAQRARVRAHETANRARKTVLSKLDQLGD
jgi:hypothetical protein